MAQDSVMPETTIQDSIKERLLKLKAGGRPMRISSIEERSAAFRAALEISADRPFLISTRKRMGGAGFEVFRQA